MNTGTREPTGGMSAPSDASSYDDREDPFSRGIPIKESAFWEPCCVLKTDHHVGVRPPLRHHTATMDQIEPCALLEQQSLPHGGWAHLRGQPPLGPLSGQLHRLRAGCCRAAILVAGRPGGAILKGLLLLLLLLLLLSARRRLSVQHRRQPVIVTSSPFDFPCH